MSDYRKTFLPLSIGPPNHDGQSYNCTFFSKKTSHHFEFFCPWSNKHVLEEELNGDNVTYLISKDKSRITNNCFPFENTSDRFKYLGEKNIHHFIFCNTCCNTSRIKQLDKLNIPNEVKRQDKITRGVIWSDWFRAKIIPFEIVYYAIIRLIQIYHWSVLYFTRDACVTPPIWGNCVIYDGFETLCAKKNNPKKKKRPMVLFFWRFFHEF